MLGKTKYQFYELFTVYSIQSLTQLASRVKKGGLIMARLILFILCALPVLFHFILFMLQYLVFVYIEKWLEKGHIEIKTVKKQTDKKVIR